MSTRRKIVALVAIVVALVMSTMVAVQWSAQGCEGWSLVAGCAYYVAITFAIWAVINDATKGAEK